MAQRIEEVTLRKMRSGQNNEVSMASAFRTVSLEIRSRFEQHVSSYRPIFYVIKKKISC
jgi:hypothetical protein